MTALASLLIALATALLRTVLQQRQAANDAQEVGRLSGMISHLEQANAALKWKADAAARADGGAALRVSDDGKQFRIDIPGDDSSPSPPGSRP